MRPRGVLPGKLLDEGTCRDVAWEREEEPIGVCSISEALCVAWSGGPEVLAARGEPEQLIEPRTRRIFRCGNLDDEEHTAPLKRHYAAILSPPRARLHSGGPMRPV